eukprot:SAG11_NODE_24952_length_365_cov_1.714286_1_plen_56_part_01
MLFVLLTYAILPLAFSSFSKSEMQSPSESSKYACSRANASSPTSISATAPMFYISY